MKAIIGTLALVGACIPGAVLAQDSSEDEIDYVAPAKAKAGLRVEGRLFYERIDDPVDEEDVVYEFGNGVGAGVEAGLDFAVGDGVVVGPYFTYDFSSLETCEAGLCFAAPQYWATGVHIGFTSGESGLIYGKLGYGQQKVTLQGTFDDPDFGTVTVDEEETGAGYNFAFGYEHGFGDTLYARGELGVSESSDIYGFDLQRGTIAVSVGARF